MAGALFVAGVTGVATVRALAPTPGEAVVIAWAGGGVGVFAVQLAVRTGACVIALASERHHAISVGRHTVCGIDHLYGIEVSVEFFGDNRRETGVDTLAHLQLTRIDEHRAVGFDLDARTNRIGQLVRR